MLVCSGDNSSSQAHTQVHNVVSANGTVVDDDVPGPEGDGVPLDDRSAHGHDGSQGCCNTFLTSNFFFSLPDSLDTALPLEELAAEESFISTSVIVFRECIRLDDGWIGAGQWPGEEDRSEDLVGNGCRSQ